MGFEEIAVAEQRFWLQILGDHARFILHALSPVESTDIKRTDELRNMFDELLIRSRQTMGISDVKLLNDQVFRYAKRLRAFKLHLLRRQLTGQVRFGLSPTFVNHMVNENEECLRLFAHLCAGEMPPALHPLHHHQLWMLDAAGHAAILNDELDPTEKPLKAQTEHFKKQFEGFYLKAVELAGYLRTNIDKFPALNRFNQEVALELHIFRNFLRELEEMELSAAILSSLSPLIPDHMAREECYYLQKLAEVSDVMFPDCDPTEPRVE